MNLGTSPLGTGEVAITVIERTKGNLSRLVSVPRGNDVLLWVGRGRGELGDLKQLNVDVVERLAICVCNNEVASERSDYSYPYSVGTCFSLFILVTIFRQRIHGTS